MAHSLTSTQSNPLYAKPSAQVGAGVVVVGASVVVVVVLVVVVVGASVVVVGA